MALVVYVFATVLMLAAGLKETLVATGQPDNVIMIRRGSQTEVQSGIDRPSAAIVETFPEIATGEDGRKLMSKEPVVLINLPKRETGKPVQRRHSRRHARTASTLRPQVRIVEGRMFRPGTSEIIAGRAIAQGFRGAAIGETLRFAQRDWTVVGVFDAGRTGFNSEIWGDAEQLLQSFRRAGLLGARVPPRPTRRASTPSSAAIESRPRLQLEAKPEQQFYADQSEALAKFISYLGTTISVIFSIGAIIGAMITMYASVASRTAEIGTLRALGFSRLSILAAFLVESLLLGFVGGAVRLVRGVVHADGADLDDELPDVLRDRVHVHADAPRSSSRRSASRCSWGSSADSCRRRAPRACRSSMRPARCMTKLRTMRALRAHRRGALAAAVPLGVAGTRWRACASCSSTPFARRRVPPTSSCASASTATARATSTARTRTLGLVEDYLHVYGVITPEARATPASAQRRAALSRRARASAARVARARAHRAPRRDASARPRRARTPYHDQRLGQRLGRDDARARSAALSRQARTSRGAPTASRCMRSRRALAPSRSPADARAGDPVAAARSLRAVARAELPRAGADGDRELAVAGACARARSRRSRKRDDVAAHRRRRRDVAHAGGRDARAKSATQRVRFLAPFDPVVWDRRRFERFWGWEYRLEAYTPPAKRKFGYYALPLLWRDDVIGWVNAQARDGSLHRRARLSCARRRRAPHSGASSTEEVERLRDLRRRGIAPSFADAHLQRRRCSPSRRPIWGSTWLAITFQLGVVAPELSVAYRFALASAIVAAWCLATGDRCASRAASTCGSSAMGATFFGFNYIGVYWAERYVASGLVAVVFSTIVFMSPIGMRVVLRRAPDRCARWWRRRWA